MRWSSWSHLLLPVFKILEICLWFVFFFLDETGIKEISSYGRWQRIYHEQLMISSKLWRLELVWFVFPSWVRQESRPHFQLWQATDSIPSTMNDILQMVRPNEFWWQEWNVGSCTPQFSESLGCPFFLEDFFFRWLLFFGLRILEKECRWLLFLGLRILERECSHFRVWLCFWYSVFSS